MSAPTHVERYLVVDECGLVQVCETVESAREELPKCAAEVRDAVIYRVLLPVPPKKAPRPVVDVDAIPLRLLELARAYRGALSQGASKVSADAARALADALFRGVDRDGYGIYRTPRGDLALWSEAEFLWSRIP